MVKVVVLVALALSSTAIVEKPTEVRPWGDHGSICPPCAEASMRVADGDTTGAITLLQQAASEDAPPGLWGELGLLLTRTAPARESEFTQRVEARTALERALAAEPDNPRWLYAYGLLLRKQGVRVDARRAFDRALAASPGGDSTLSNTDAARLHAELGRILEEHVLDFRGLIVNAEKVPLFSPGCAATLGSFCWNFTNPSYFHEALLASATADDVVDDDLRRMRAAFEQAFTLDPTLRVAARGLLGELARQQDWRRFSEVARQYVDATEGSPWPRVFLAAGMYRMGKEAAADSQAKQALRDLPAGERSILENIAQVVTSEVEDNYRQRNAGERIAATRHFWTLSNPLYLTDVNERFLEHLTRTALAELWFGVPARDERGYQTERGVVLIRYGVPRHIRQIRRSQELVRILALDTVPGEQRNFSESGGRWVLWTYATDRPSFIFEKRLKSRHAKHAMRSRSMHYAQDLRASHPSTFELENFGSVPHQIARFLGGRSDVEVDVFASMPTDSAGRDARAGLFFLPQSEGAEITRLTTELTLADTVKVATFRVPLAPGSYPFSIEAAAEDGSVRAASRGTIEAEPFSANGLDLSDILVARDIRPQMADAQVQGRRDLVIRPAADLTIRQGEPLSLYFEIYPASATGSEAGAADSVGRYRVKLEINDSEDKNVIARVLAGIDQLIGREPPDGAIEWERVVFGAKDRIPEWLEVSLADREPGVYRARFTVTDLQSGTRATTEREFRVGEQ